MLLFGGVVGPFFWGYLSDRMKKKPLIIARAQPKTEGIEALPEYSGYRLLGKFYGIAYLKGMMEAVYGKHPISPLLM